MSHLVRCRGGAWTLRRSAEGGTWIVFDDDFEPADTVWWNAAGAMLSRDKPWSSHPAWLPIAWLCCEAGPVEGPLFAAAILDAEPGGDTPALIACDWLWGLGAEGVLDLLTNRVEGADLQFRYSLASWGQNLIATRCVACGGRRDGWDDIAYASKTEGAFAPHISARGKRSIVQKVREIELSKGGALIPADCPLCGFPAHPTPTPWTASVPSCRSPK